MSTRGLIGFRYQDRDKLAYNHADSYPHELGDRVLKELRGVTNWDTVKERIGTLIPINENRKMQDLDGMIKAEVRRHFPEANQRREPTDCYDLFQPLQGTLKPYLDGKLMFMPDANDFIYDSLFCEWAYIANLDSDCFEVWRGLQTTHDQTENARYGAEADRSGYYPCKLIKEYEFDDLPAMITSA